VLADKTAVFDDLHAALKAAAAKLGS